VAPTKGRHTGVVSAYLCNEDLLPRSRAAATARADCPQADAKGVAVERRFSAGVILENDDTVLAVHRPEPGT